MSEQEKHENDVKVDRFQLDLECESQSSISQYWSDKLADAKEEMNLADVDLDRLKAKRLLHFMVSPKEKVKVTVDSVKAMVAEDQTVVEAEKLLINTKKEVDRLQGYVKALDQRSSQLTNLVKLQVSGYYGTGKTSAPADDIGDQARADLNKKTKTRSKSWHENNADSAGTVIREPMRTKTKEEPHARLT